MEHLKVTLIQSHLFWENPEANRAQFSEKIQAISGQTNLVILPEMFTTGFSMAAKTFAESEDGDTVLWMQQMATTHNIALTGSIIIGENGSYYNRLFFVFPNGKYETYDKRHTFTLAGEHKIYKAGSEKLVVNYLGWKICPLICYDLRFPVWARNTEMYDVLLFTANWPKKRIAAWDALLKARAIENMSYCIGVNRVGLDGNGHEYTGHSAIYDVLGNIISSEDFEQEFVSTIVLEKSHIENNRKHLQFLNDRDIFSLE